jgi:pyruvate formate lyase activating enzyme
MRTICDLCPHHCALEEGQTGLCYARQNQKGKIVPLAYGKLTSLALDPIEKKPFARYMAGHYILSAGSFGCNMKCPFCQNYEISYADSCSNRVISPEELVRLAVQEKSHDNIGLAFTYNEPFINYEYVMDCFKLAKQEDLQCVLVTNGMVSQKYLEELLPYVDAMNIDLKAFRPAIYRQKLQGDLACVKTNIALANKACHVEVTSLIVPGLNDSSADMEEEAKWLAGVDPAIPLHITRFFPRYHMSDKEPTDLDLIHSLVEIASKYLQYVYKGNC